MPRPAALGLRHVWVLKTTEEIDSAVVTRVRMFNDLRDATGRADDAFYLSAEMILVGQTAAGRGY